MQKVLIVTYYWPPAGGPGVQRWLKFVKYLPEFGIEPIVYIPKNPHYPLKDIDLEQEVPMNLKVLKNAIFEPYAFASLLSRKNTERISSGIIPERNKQGWLQKLLLFIRGNFFIPDARKFWVKPSVKYLSSYLEENEIDTVITTGPPHSLHLIGLELKQKMKLTWIADFRDPWTQIGYHNELKLTPKSQEKHRELELRVLKGADHLVTTSFTTKKEFEGKISTPISVITNGYDYEKVRAVEPDKVFSLSHIGSLLSGRNPEQLWEAIRELLMENADFAEDFQLKLVGTVGEPVLESIQKNDLEGHCKIVGYVSHREALEIQRSSQLLLLIEINSEETRGIIPGKLFEYMVSQRPILAIGPEGSDVQKIIRETNTGSYFYYNGKEEIKQLLLEKYRAYKNNELASHPIGLQKYSRKNLTQQLSKIIQSQKRS